MLEIPIGKALVPEEIKYIQWSCKLCDLNCGEGKGYLCDGRLACLKDDREDGKNVVFKLVDYTGEG